MSDLDLIKKIAVGNRLAVVRAEAESKGWVVRVVRHDGEWLIGTCEFNPNRINVSVDDGIVTDVSGIG